MITLASASAARATMLRAAGVVFNVQVPQVDERNIKNTLTLQGATAEHVADTLAELKSQKISHRTYGLVLGSDQVLITAAGAMLDKPADRAGAEQQLRSIAGAEHRLIVAAVISDGGTPVWRASGSARLTVRTMSDGFISDYLDREGASVFDCVGTYRIEGLGAQLFTHIVGDPFIIQGLPLLAVLDYLRLRGELQT